MCRSFKIKIAFVDALVLQNSKRSADAFASRNDGNTKVILPKAELPVEGSEGICRQAVPGDYVAVKVSTCT